MQVDKGGIKHVLSGSNVMCPGLTSPEGRMDEVEKGQIVAIYGEGKEHAMAIGITLMSTANIRSVNKGHCIENIHHMTDGLWTQKIK